MTNEEAREIIKQMCAELPFYEDKKDEALELAIKALEQTEIWNATTKDRQIIAPKGTFRKIWEDEQQPKTRWIPCSERMPEVSDYYLIQHSRHICPDEMAVAYYSVEEAELDKNYTWEFKPFADCKEVIAWMPLPEPYMESEDEE